jgi:hypothetical protein
MQLLWKGHRCGEEVDESIAVIGFGQCWTATCRRNRRQRDEGSWGVDVNREGAIMSHSLFHQWYQFFMLLNTGWQLSPYFPQYMNQPSRVQSRAIKPGNNGFHSSSLITAIQAVQSFSQDLQCVALINCYLDVPRWKLTSGSV